MGKRSETPASASASILGADALPKPLDSVGKLEVVKKWIGPASGLRFSEFKVFHALVHRQNPKSGQCNPSVTTLMTDTGLKERAVRGALAKLQRVGALWRNGRSGAKRKYVIVPVELLDVENPTKNFRSGKSMHSPAAEHAQQCRKTIQECAYRKDKGNKKENRQCARVRGLAYEQTSSGEISDAIDRKEFEDAISRRFRKCGGSLEDVVAVPSEIYEQRYVEWMQGKVTIEKAATAMFEELAMLRRT